VVLDARATPAMRHRMETVTTLSEELFLLITLGDDRAVDETYVMGEAKKPRRRGINAPLAAAPGSDGDVRNWFSTGPGSR